MFLYHGSNLEVKEPSLKYSRNSLDFGRAFYTTTDFGQAEKWAKRVVHMRNSGKIVVSVFETDDEQWKNLSVLHFKNADRDWLKTVVGYRTDPMFFLSYDIISGPVANDRTIDVINQYIAGRFPENIALELLLPMKLKDQWAFKTDKALDTIKWKESVFL